jgi:hypothetical protein
MAQAIPQENITEVKRAILPRVLFYEMDLYNAKDLHFAPRAGKFLRMFAALPERKSIGVLRPGEEMLAKTRQ